MTTIPKPLLETDHLPIPPGVAVCPYCDGLFTAEITGHEQQDDDTWTVNEIMLDCNSEPDMDDPDWEAWLEAHSDMPYVYMLPLEVKVTKWINASFRVEVADE